MNRHHALAKKKSPMLPLAQSDRRNFQHKTRTGSLQGHLAARRFFQKSWNCGGFVMRIYYLDLWPHGL